MAVQKLSAEEKFGPRREEVGRGEQNCIMFIFTILPFRQILAGPSNKRAMLWY